MADGGTTEEPTGLAGVALRYPEKAFYLGQVFNDTTNSYKLLWFIAILSLIRRSDAQLFPLVDVLTEMAVSAWHPVCLYRLSLGRQDKLQHVVQDIQQRSDLQPNANLDLIRQFVETSGEAKAQLEYFRRYVPTRFLAPWFAEKLRGIEDSRRDAQIQELAKESQRTPFASPYWLDGRSIRLNDSWRVFLLENLGVVQGFAEHHFALHLQARNPNIPGVVNKLHAPTERQLAAAHEFWRFVRADFEKSGRPERFYDIYSERPLDASFGIDHFLPWSFVAHDLLWNLAPVERTTNSSKNDVLPDLDIYLPRLASLHFNAIDAAKKRPKLLEDYTDCFKVDALALVALGEDGLVAKYREIMLPQAQIAMNQGFESGWRMRSPAVVPAIQRETSPPRFSGGLVGGERQEALPANVIIELFSTESGQRPMPGWLPFYSLKVAAGSFSAGDAPEPEGWVDAVKHGFSRRLDKWMFVTRIKGESMSPTISDGSYCVFRAPVEGTRQGLVVLAQKRDFTDPETGGSYTVKRYRSTKSVNDQGWKHDLIQLVPDNPDRARFPVLEFVPEDEADLQVIAEFIQMLNAPA